MNPFNDDCSCGNCGSNNNQNQLPPSNQEPNSDDGSWGGPEPIRRPYRIVTQTHVYYDDGTACTFTTPLLESSNMHPMVVKKFLLDYFQWVNLASNAGFYCPRNHESIVRQTFVENDKQSTQQVIVMPSAAMRTHSFTDNPNDSILASLNYPGCEVKYQMPILVGADLGPFPNWDAFGSGSDDLPNGYNG